jgi:hypothetical protein
MKLVATTAALVMAFASFGCSKDKGAESAHEAESKGVFEQTGDAVGGAAEDVGGAVKEGTVDTVEQTGIEGTQRFECVDGTVFTVDYENDGRSARVKWNEQEYWLDVDESGTGRFTSEAGTFWTTGRDMGSLELAGQKSLQNCQRK